MLKERNYLAFSNFLSIFSDIKSAIISDLICESEIISKARAAKVGMCRYSRS